MSDRRRNLELGCVCGEPLARYRKGGKGRLIKLFLERIAVDHAGVFLTEPKRELHDEVLCPGCSRRVATIQVIRGKYAAKLNQGSVRIL